VYCSANRPLAIILLCCGRRRTELRGLFHCITTAQHARLHWMEIMCTLSVPFKWTPGLLNCLNAMTGSTNWSAQINISGRSLYMDIAARSCRRRQCDCQREHLWYRTEQIDRSDQLDQFSRCSGRFSGPYALTLGAQRTVIVFSSFGCFGVDPTGGVLWVYASSGAGNDPGSIDPIIYNNQMLVAQNGSCGGAAALVNLGGSGTLTSVACRGRRCSGITAACCTTGMFMDLLMGVDSSVLNLPRGTSSGRRRLRSLASTRRSCVLAVNS